MSDINTLSPTKEKKRPSVSSKCLLNIKSLITQNVSLNTQNKNSSLRLSTTLLPPLPLIDSLITTKELNNEIHLKKLSKKQKYRFRFY